MHPPRHVIKPRVKAHGAGTTHVHHGAHVLAIISLHKTLCSRHFTGLFGVIAAMFGDSIITFQVAYEKG